MRLETARLGRTAWAGPVAALAALAVLALALAEPAAAQGMSPFYIGFDDMNPGDPPRGFSCDRAGGGGPTMWLVEEEPRPAKRGKVLVERSAEPAKDRIAACLYDLTRLRNLELQVAFKASGGEVERAGALVFRAADSGNFYLLSASARTNRVWLSRVLGGLETEIMSGNATVAPDIWHTLKIKADRDRFVAWFDGAKVIDVYDDRILRPGRAGLATRADSLTYFDEMMLTPLREQGSE